MKTPLLVLASLLATALLLPAVDAAPLPVPKCVVGGRCDAGYTTCQNAEPLVDTIIATVGGAIPVQVVKNVVQSTGVNCLPGSGGACPFFTGTPLGPVYFREVHYVAGAADCLAVFSLATVGQGASVRLVGGGCRAYAYAYTSGGNAMSTPVVHWAWCP